MNEDLLMSLPVDCSTRDVAQVLGMAVRSVQLMVDRGELEAWKTPGGHRRIARASVERWLKQRNEPVAGAASAESAAAVPADRAAATKAGGVVRGHSRRPRVLLIEDSAHFQNLVRLLVAHGFPQADLHVAEDGIVGLAMAGELQPDVLI
ncbi:MAG: helix-turn-helix domain-containing protein, partial [Burkholderiaceae bacterium]|nr:helix-turn-helix domain-containing protein [Burkholderiaceae bacterium]